MKIVDLNILLYAVNPDARHHDRIVEWWEEQLNGDESIGLAWTVTVGFLRISTHPRIFPSPLTPREAIGHLDAWLALDIVTLLTEKRDHWRALRDLLADVGVAGFFAATPVVLHVVSPSTGKSASSATASTIASGSPVSNSGTPPALRTARSARPAPGGYRPNRCAASRRS